MTASTASHRVPTASGTRDAVSGRASRETAENGNRVPPTASPRPTASRPRPDRFPALSDETSGTASRAIYKRDAGRGSSEHPGLATWLNNLKLRNLGITTSADGPRITGTRTDLITPTDWHNLTRHRHTLTLAATGTHPTWWTWASGQHRNQHPHIDDLPWTCGTCGHPATAWLDADLVAWCDHHVDTAAL